MTIIEIQPLENGAHRNQTGNAATVPDGWAILPPTLDTPNFPFGDVTTDNSTPPVVTGWVPVDIPETPEPVEEPTQLDRVEAQVTYTAILTDTLIPEV